MKRDFLHITDLTTREILDFIDLAQEIKTKVSSKNKEKSITNIKIKIRNYKNKQMKNVKIFRKYNKKRIKKVKNS